MSFTIQVDSSYVSFMSEKDYLEAKLDYLKENNISDVTDQFDFRNFLLNNEWSKYNIMGITYSAVPHNHTLEAYNQTFNYDNYYTTDSVDVNTFSNNLVSTSEVTAGSKFLTWTEIFNEYPIHMYNDCSKQSGDKNQQQPGPPPGPPPPGSPHPSPKQKFSRFDLLDL